MHHLIPWNNYIFRNFSFRNDLFANRYKYLIILYLKMKISYFVCCLLSEILMHYIMCKMTPCLTFSIGLKYHTDIFNYVITLSNHGWTNLKSTVAESAFKTNVNCRFLLHSSSCHDFLINKTLQIISLFSAFIAKGL